MCTILFVHGAHTILFLARPQPCLDHRHACKLQQARAQGLPIVLASAHACRRHLRTRAGGTSARAGGPAAHRRHLLTCLWADGPHTRAGGTCARVPVALAHVPAVPTGPAARARVPAASARVPAARTHVPVGRRPAHACRLHLCTRAGGPRTRAGDTCASAGDPGPPHPVTSSGPAVQRPLVTCSGRHVQRPLVTCSGRPPAAEIRCPSARPLLHDSSDW